MNFEQEVRTLARRCIMEEINNLGIKALLREQIVEAGFTHEQIRAMVRDTIDSFCRSALNAGDVEGYVREAVNGRAAQAADKEIQKIIGRYNGFSGSRAVEDAIVNAIQRQARDKYVVTVSVQPRSEQEMS